MSFLMYDADATVVCLKIDSCQKQSSKLLCAVHLGDLYWSTGIRHHCCDILRSFIVLVESSKLG